MVVFFLGAWITMKYIWPPLIHAIEERQKKIADAWTASIWTGKAGTSPATSTAA